MMPMILPALAWSRPPYRPGVGVDLADGLGPPMPGERREQQRDAAAEGEDPTRPMMLSTIAVVADGWLAGGAGR